MTPLARYRRHLRIQVLLAVAAFTVALQQFELLFILGAAAVARFGQIDPIGQVYLREAKGGAGGRDRGGAASTACRRRQAAR